ncbi:MAG: hypothetical protein QM811_18340 [Pirellulales bacterium]
MTARKSVALLIETSNGYARGLAAGVIDYVRTHDSWSIYLPEQQRGAAPPAWLAHWRGDGVIRGSKRRPSRRWSRSWACPPSI